MNGFDVLLGLQWGDEGKGKIIDVLTPQYDIIARFQGGPNAGHSLEFNDQKHVLHLIPSGIFHEGKMNLLGNGMVICPIAFKEEIEKLLPFIPMEELKKRIVISSGAKIILPVHRLMDKASETAKGAKKIGSTLKGIGPAYTDHTSRNAVLMCDIADSKFIQKVSDVQEKHLISLALQHKKCWDAEELTKEMLAFFDAIHFMREFQVVNGPYWIDKQLNIGKKILAEGAQGTLLDVDHGNYPFVTSSNTTIGGVCTGLGVPANSIGKVYGLFKAYCTRVGNGPFPTELGGEASDEWCRTKKVEDENALYPNADINDKDPFTQGIALRRKAYEFGATTGRLRRCGWLDLPALKYACMINGVTDLVMSKTDILSGFERVKVCDYYIVDGHETDEMPRQITENLKAHYRDFPGWADVATAKKIMDLPNELQDYLDVIEEETGISINILSTGPDREQIIRQ